MSRTSASKLLAACGLLVLLTLSGCGGGGSSSSGGGSGSTVGAAAKLAFTAQPGTATAGSAISPSVSVSIEDANGNLVTTATNTITLAIGTNPSSGTLSGTTSVAAAGGVATFPNLTINNAGTGYTLSATASGLTGATSNAFSVLGAPTKLAFTVQPSSVAAGISIAPAVTVAVEDASGNIVTTATNQITIAIGTNPSSGTLGGTVVANATSGVATFSSLDINKVGTGYTLTAGTNGLTGATSSAFNVTVGAAAKLAFTTQPSSVTAGAPIAPAVQVTVEDALGNVETAATNQVTIAIGTNPASGVLTGTATANAVSGVATFSNLAISGAGTGYTLTASATGLTGATSGTFNVLVGTASKLAFIVQPANTVAATSIAPAIQVAVEDGQGNIVTSASNPITVSISTNPAAGTLGGTATVNAVSGVATFPGLSINNVGTGYTLAAAATGLTGTTSNSFNIVVSVGPATKLKFVVGPSSVVAGSSIAPAVQVAVEDSNNNVVSSATNSITISIGTNPASGTLGGTSTANAVGGVATFSNLSINAAGTGYTLGASATGLTSAVSGTFNVAVGTATKLAFTVEPSGVSAGSTISPPVQVAVEDNSGNVVTSAANQITVAIGTNPSIGTLSGTAAANAIAGVATYSNLSINNVGTGYTLTASATGFTTVASTAFNVTAGVPTVQIIPPSAAPLQAGSAASTFSVRITNDQSGDAPTVTSFTVNGVACTSATCGTFGTPAFVSLVSGTGTYSMLYTPPATLSAGVAPIVTVTPSLSAPFFAGTTGFSLDPAGVAVTFSVVGGLNVVQAGSAAKTFTVTVYNDIVNSGVGEGVTIVPLNGAGIACSNLSVNSCGTLGTPSVSTSGTTTTTTVTYTPPASVPAEPYDRPRFTAISIADSTKFANPTFIISPAAVAAPLSILFSQKFDSALTGGSAVSIAASFTDASSVKTASWTLTANGVTCPQPTCGTLGAPTVTSNGNAVTSTVMYTPPSSVPTGAGQSSPTITATMSANPAASDSSTFSIVNGACGTGNEKVLSGSYALLLRGGAEGNGYVTTAGSFTADGSGHITGGLLDSSRSFGSAIGLTIQSSGSSYSVGSDNRGCLTLENSNGVTQTFRIALGSLSGAPATATQGTITASVDTSGQNLRAEGVLKQQNLTGLTSGTVSGTYAFGYEGVDAVGQRIASAGLFTSNGSGTLTSTTFDFNDGGTTGTLSGAGTYSLATNAANGRGTSQTMVSTGGGTVTYNYVTYVISPSDLFVLSSDPIDATHPVESGEALLQSGTFSTSILASGTGYVFYTGGIDSGTGASTLAVGQSEFATGGNATITLDENDSGIEQAEVSGAATFTVAASGRMTATGQGVGNNPPVIYLVDSTQGFIVGTDGSVSAGYLQKQSANSFSTSSLTGNFFFGGTSTTTTSGSFDGGTVALAPASPSGTLTGTDDDSSPNYLLQGCTQSCGGGLNPNMAISGSYTFSALSAVPGQGNVGSQTIGYVVSPTKLIFMQEGGTTQQNAAAAELFVVQQ